jgi:ABC-type nitrate/sulfonate/bicarbonate transport system substrate-binding protein
MAPPEMPAALYARQVDAYATGEPFGAVAEVAGYARPLYMTRDRWPTYVCCVLTVHQDLIDRERPTVRARGSRPRRPTGTSPPTSRPRPACSTSGRTS